MDLTKVLESARKEWSRYLREGGMHRRRALGLYRRSLNQAKKMEDWGKYAQSLRELSSILLSYDSPEKIYQAKRMLEEGISLLSERGLMCETLLVQTAIFPVLLLLAELEPVKTTTILKDGLGTISNLMEMPELENGDRLWLKYFQGRFYEEIAHWDREMRLNFRKKARSCFLEAEQSSQADLMRKARFRRALMLIEDEEFKQAEDLLRECLDLAVNSGCERDTGEICQLLASLCERKGDFKGANQYLKRTLSCWQKFGRISTAKGLGSNS